MAQNGEQVNDGGPAYPDWMPATHGGAVHHHGMTLRDYFAGQALAGMLADPNINTTTEDRRIALARTCYALACDMLAVRGGAA